MYDITLDLSVKAGLDGGSLRISDPKQVEVTTRVKAVILAQTTEYELKLDEIARDKVLFMAIVCSDYTAGLTYMIGDDFLVFNFNHPQVFFGPEQVKLLPVDPTKLKITNPALTDIEVSVLVAWDRS